MSYWLSVLHVREYEGDTEKPNETSALLSASHLPRPRWDLVVTLKQLLRDSHCTRSTLHPPRPSTMGFSEIPKLRNAGIAPLSTSEIKQLSKRYN